MKVLELSVLTFIKENYIITHNELLCIIAELCIKITVNIVSCISILFE